MNASSICGSIPNAMVTSGKANTPRRSKGRILRLGWCKRKRKVELAMSGPTHSCRCAPSSTLVGPAPRQMRLAIWIVQFVGREIRVLDYIEGVGQVLGYYAAELRKRGYQGAVCFLPHDGVNRNPISGKRYADHLSDAGFDVSTIPNQGPGAAAMRIEAVRRALPRCWFNERTTEPGRDALGYYHERKDEGRNVGLGPEHDWSSHAADAFGLMAVVYEEPPRSRSTLERHRDNQPPGGTHWSA